MKTTNLNIRISKELYEIIEAEAKSQKMTTSEYARVATIMSLIMDGNVDAFKLGATVFGEAVKERMKKTFKEKPQLVKA